MPTLKRFMQNYRHKNIYSLACSIGSIGIAAILLRSQLGLRITNVPLLLKQMQQRN